MKIRNLILIALVAISISSCHQKPQFQAPIDPYGLPYRVGSLDGHPVNLGQAFSYLEYDDEDIWKKKSFWERFQPRKQRDYHSVIASFGFDFRYPDNLLLTGYYKTPQLAQQLYNKENEGADKFNSPWVNVGVHAGKYYGAGLDSSEHIMTMFDISPSIVEGKPYYSGVVVKTNENIYGLEKYTPHPETIKKYGLDAYTDVYDVYIVRNKKNEATGIIKCDYNSRLQYCDFTFNMTPELKTTLNVQFRKSQLKNWQGIKESTKTIMRGLINNQIK